MTKISDLSEPLTEELKAVLCDAINHCGEGDHPVADEKTIDHFCVDYALRCLVDSFAHSQNLAERKLAALDVFRIAIIRGEKHA